MVLPWILVVLVVIAAIAGFSRWLKREARHEPHET